MRNVEVLYVEDDAADADFANAAFEELGSGRLTLRVVSDGESAAQALGIHPGAPAPKKLPGMILLDLNIPRIHGKELLRRIKTSDVLASIPVVVLSTSERQSDIDESYRLGAAGYFTKPANYSRYRGIFQAICDYWGKNAAFPSAAIES